MSASVAFLFEIQEPVEPLTIPQPPTPMIRVRKTAVVEVSEENDPRQLAFWPLHELAQGLSRRGVA